MTYWTTYIIAKDPYTGELKKYAGQNIPGLTKKDAKRYCQLNGLGYLQVEDKLVAEIPENNMVPDWEKAIYYDKIQNN